MNSNSAKLPAVSVSQSVLRPRVLLQQGDTVYAKVVPEVDERELEKMVNPIVQEYFEHGDTKEVQVCRGLLVSRGSRHPYWRL